MSAPDVAGEIDFFNFGLDFTTGFGGTFEGTTVLGCRSGIILDAFRFLGGRLVFVELVRSVGTGATTGETGMLDLGSDCELLELESVSVLELVPELVLESVSESESRIDSESDFESVVILVRTFFSGFSGFTGLELEETTGVSNSFFEPDVLGRESCFFTLDIFDWDWD